MATTPNDSRMVAYTELPGWVKQCFEDKTLDHLPEGIKAAISSLVDLQRASINHARFHARYVIFWIDDIEPESNVAFRHFELTLPFKVRGVPRTRLRVRSTEERLHFVHADWEGEHDGWDVIERGAGKLVPMEGRQLRSPFSPYGDADQGDE